MGAASYPISSTQPVPIYPGGKQAPVMLYNQDVSDTIYVSDIPSGLSGFPLGPGDTITWDGDKSLYAWIGSAGLVANLIVLDNGGSISSARAIADQIIQAGLADDIATSIVASSLAGNIGGQVAGSALPSNTANAIKIAGVPIIDSPVILANRKIVTWDINNPTPVLNYNISAFQSVSIRIDAPSTGTLAPDQWIINFGFYSDTPSNNGILIASYEYVLDFNYSASHTIELPAIAKNMYVDVSQQAGLNNLVMSIVGSYRPIDKPVAYMNSFRGTPPPIGAVYGDPSENYFSWQLNMTASGVFDEYPPIKSGPAIMSVKYGSVVTTGFAAVELKDAASGGHIATDFSVLNGKANVTTTTRVNIPNRPIVIRASSTSSLAPTPLNMVISLIWE